MAQIVRRVRQAGIYFVTSRTWQSRALFRKSETAQILLEQLLACRDRSFFKLHEFEIIPDHFHALLTPSPDTTLEKAVQMTCERYLMDAPSFEAGSSGAEAPQSEADFRRG
ncbi:MAG TPA: transposase [Candidatus Acidoferrales bacterium]|nr:transposase [Candidatus Acidoferrales bacterium]